MEVQKLKKLIILLTLLLASLLLAACEESQIHYDGQLRPMSEVEEIISDKLEVENPHLDLEVSIFEETED
jgi:ABC-type oligopeptide transport system substrate-binding subunit